MITALFCIYPHMCGCKFSRKGEGKMCKTYAEVAMEVIREDWEYRKSQNNPSFSQERIARMMHISRSQLAKALSEEKNPTISFLCSYATAVGRPIDELLHTIGLREVEEQRMMLIQNQMSTKSAVNTV